VRIAFLKDRLKRNALWLSALQPGAQWKIERVVWAQILRTAEREFAPEGKTGCSLCSGAEWVIATFTEIVVWQISTCLALDTAVPLALVFETQSLEQAVLAP